MLCLHSIHALSLSLALSVGQKPYFSPSSFLSLPHPKTTKMPSLIRLERRKSINYRKIKGAFAYCIYSN